MKLPLLLTTISFASAAAVPVATITPAPVPALEKRYQNFGTQYYPEPNPWRCEEARRTQSLKTMRQWVNNECHDFVLQMHICLPITCAKSDMIYSTGMMETASDWDVWTAWGTTSWCPNTYVPTMATATKTKA